MPGVDDRARTVRNLSSRRAAAGEVVRPGRDLGVLLDELSSLTFGLAAPDPELDPVVERVGKAFGDDCAIATYQGRSVLRRTADEEFVRISGSTQGLRDPGEATFRWRHG